MSCLASYLRTSGGCHHSFGSRELPIPVWFGARRARMQLAHFLGRCATSSTGNEQYLLECEFLGFHRYILHRFRRREMFNTAHPGPPTVHTPAKIGSRRLILLTHFGKEGEPETVMPKISQGTVAETIGTTRSRVSRTAPSSSQPAPPAEWLCYELSRRWQQAPLRLPG